LYDGKGIAGEGKGNKKKIRAWAGEKKKKARAM